MVARLHHAGIEVILDVVYNHTAEGNELGPTLSFKGIDNASYYRLLPDKQRFYINDTGTGQGPCRARRTAVRGRRPTLQSRAAGVFLCARLSRLVRQSVAVDGNQHRRRGCLVAR